MERDEVLQVLRAHESELSAFGVKSLALFGSCARNEMQEDSDVDLLVEFSKPTGLFGFVRLKNYLEKILKHPVDLATRDALKRQLRDRILAEAIYAG